MGFVFFPAFGWFSEGWKGWADLLGKEEVPLPPAIVVGLAKVFATAYKGEIGRAEGEDIDEGKVSKSEVEVKHCIIEVPGDDKVLSILGAGREEEEAGIAKVGATEEGIVDVGVTAEVMEAGVVEKGADVGDNAEGVEA